MCMPSDDTEAHYNDSGCLLEIKSAEYLPDGRLILETVGVKRFKVLERSVKDGYDTAKVEWITDTVVEGDNEKKILHKVKEKVYLMARNWYDNLSAEQKAKIAQFFGTNNLSCENFLQENQDTGRLLIYARKQ
jgi:Lon protease-like protein